MEEKWGSVSTTGKRKLGGPGPSGWSKGGETKQTQRLNTPRGRQRFGGSVRDPIV